MLEGDKITQAVKKPTLSLQFDTSGRTCDVLLTDIDSAKKFDSFECSLSLYSIDTTVKADDFLFDPYEEYISDIAAGKRSTYEKIPDTANQLFGMVLGLVIVVFFAVFLPEQLLSIESVVSIFAAYTVGKEIWIDVDAFLQKLSRNWPVRWLDRDFFFERQQFGTFHRFWQRARIARFGHSNTLPAQIDFISHSNSKTIDMQFDHHDLKALPLDSARILSITLLPNTANFFKTNKYVVVCRFGFVRKLLFFKFVEEYFQAVEQGKIGTLTLANEWYPQGVLKKIKFQVGNLNVDFSDGVIRKKQALFNVLKIS